MQGLDVTLAGSTGQYFTAWEVTLLAARAPEGRRGQLSSDQAA